MKHYVLLLIAAVSLSACAIIPPEAYTNRGDPEALLDVSSEVVNLDITSQSSVDELSAWLNEDAPSRAELYCAADSAFCQQAEEMMGLYGVPYQQVPSSEMSVALVYERVLARDCVNRYVDNPINPYHLNHPAFGCSLAANMVQHVTDKRQFVRPNLLDGGDAKKAVQAYQNYSKRTEVKQPEGISDSLVSEGSSD